MRLKYTQILILLLVFLSNNLSFAQNNEDIVIPLSQNSIYSPKGVGVGLSIGVLKEANYQNIVTWLGQLAYSYNSILTGGFKFNFTGGPLDSLTTINVTKYTFNAKFHYNKEKIDLYAGPITGFQIGYSDKISFSINNSTYPGSITENEENPHSNNTASSGFIIGWEIGVGWKFQQNWGLWVAQYTEIIPTITETIVFTTGLAYDIGYIIPKIKKDSKHLFLYTEFSRSTYSFKIITAPSNLLINIGLTLNI